MSRATWLNPVETFDASDDDAPTLIRVIVHDFEADNPMASTCTKHRGMACLKPCRRCHFGAESQLERARPEGLVSLMEVRLTRC
jgi:hypothetical protein